MRRTGQELREDRGTIRSEFATAVWVTADDVTAWAMSQAAPTVSRLKVPTTYFRVRDDQFRLRLSDPPSVEDRAAKLLAETKVQVISLEGKYGVTHNE